MVIWGLYTSILLLREAVIYILIFFLQIYITPNFKKNFVEITLPHFSGNVRTIFTLTFYICKLRSVWDLCAYLRVEQINRTRSRRSHFLWDQVVYNEIGRGRSGGGKYHAIANMVARGLCVGKSCYSWISSLERDWTFLVGKVDFR